MSNGSPADGIWAGYGNSSTPNPGVNGTVVINNSANITAPADKGINAFNFGNGNVTVNDLVWYDHLRSIVRHSSVRGGWSSRRHRDQSS